MKNNLDFQYLSNNERKMFSIVLSRGDEKKILPFDFNMSATMKKKKKRIFLPLINSNIF